MQIAVAEACGEDADDWVRLRSLLWPFEVEPVHRSDIDAILASPRHIAYLARAEDGTALGFAEASLRVDYVNGCETTPVAFLEGIYVVDEMRRKGVARRLSEAVEGWAGAHGCREFASDALADNLVSHQMHEHLGFKETERVVYFRKMLTQVSGTNCPGRQRC